MNTDRITLMHLRVPLRKGRVELIAGPLNILGGDVASARVSALHLDSAE